MADTAIPIPDDAQAVIDQYNRQVSAACEKLADALATTARDAEQGIQELGRVLNRTEEQ